MRRLIAFFMICSCNGVFADQPNLGIPFSEDGRTISTAELSLKTYESIADGRILVGLKHVKSTEALHDQLAIIQSEKLKLQIGTVLTGEKLMSTLGTDQLIVSGRKAFTLSDNGKRVIMILSTQETLVEKQSPKKVKQGEASTAKPIYGERVSWKNETYKSRITKVSEKKWQEFSDETGNVVWNLDERLVDPNVIELFLIERDQRIRLYPDRLEIFLDNEWKWVAKGYWTDLSSKVSRNVNQQTLDRAISQSIPELTEAEVVSVQIVDHEDAQGRPRKMIVCQIKNTGRKAIRVVDGIYIVMDSFGGEINRIPYTMLADSDSSPGLKPGEIRDNSSQGFFLPIGSRASSAKIEITKVLENNPSF